ncbi:hypothetical protein E1091_01465 [Micromonospora fluostatini]|uniref:Capsid maturation protease n=1 Tax=Micromonospora fluostatini TaxID=1629071 RepID=A0ABY2DPL5_9ACTN|nr:hypothetical protein E1091_01465 [Micromonospora fluostatini]
MPSADGSLTAAEIAALYALIRAQAAIREQLTQVAVAGALAPLRLVNWFDPADVAQAAERVVQVVQPAQLRMAQVVDASMARMLTTMTGRPVRPVGAIDVRQLRRAVSPAVARLLAEVPPVEVEPDGDLDLDRFFLDEEEAEDDRRRLEEEERDAEEDERRRREEDDELAEAERRRQEDEDEREAAERRRRDREADARRRAQLQALDPMEPYVRVGAQFRYLVTRGAPEREARQAVAERVTRVADMDISLAQRAQEAAVVRRSPRITGYRRILQPELGGGGPPCGLCVVAADRVYRREDLKPIHDRCRCGVMPIIGGVDPGLVLNGDDLDRLYTAAGDTTSGRALKRLRVGIGEHGELGPILFPYGRGFRDAEEAESDQRVASIERRLQGLERSTASLRRQLDGGETRLRPLVDYQTRLIEQLREQLVA